jgi:cytochrome c biogenesis protein ResB
MLRVNRKGFFSPPLSETSVTLREFEAKFEQDKYPVEYAAHLEFSDEFNPGLEKTVRVNRPVKLDKWQIFLHRYGFAPRFELRDTRGNLFFDYFVNLIVPLPEQMDSFDIPSHDLRVEARFFPDFEARDQETRQQYGILKNSGMRVRMLSDDNPIGEADVALGETVQLGPYSLKFAELRYWAWFGIVYDPGYGFIIFGFILCVAGLAGRFMVPEKWLQVKVERREDQSLVTLTGHSRYFPALFERESERIRKALGVEQEKAEVATGQRSGQ